MIVILSNDQEPVDILNEITTITSFRAYLATQDGYCLHPISCISIDQQIDSLISGEMSENNPEIPEEKSTDSTKWLINEKRVFTETREEFQERCQHANAPDVIRFEMI